MNITEIQKDIDTYEHRLQNPGSLSPQQLNLYRSTLNAARARLKQLQASSAGGTTGRRRQMHQEQPAQQGSAWHTSPPKYTTNTETRQPPAPGLLRTILVNIEGAGTPEVKIEWTDKEPETVTEGVALSRYKSCIRDITESTLYKQERFSQLSTYTSWHRAIGYYSALIEFWQKPPSADDLNMSRAIATRHLFGLIQTATSK